jgi:MFS family permease
VAGKKKFHGWVVAAACFLMMFTIGGLINMTFSLYTIPVTKSLGVSRTAFTFCVSLRSIVLCVFSLFYSLLAARFGIRKLMAAGCALVTAALIAFAAGNIWLFYIGGILQGIGYSLTMTLPLSVVVANWFVKKRGTVLGVVYAASGAGGVLFSPVAGVMIEKLGWQVSFLISAAVCAAVSIPSLILMKAHPSEMGQTALGEEEEAKSSADETAVSSGLTTAEAIRTPSFWLFVAVFVFSGMSICAAYMNAAPHFVDVGFDPIFVSGVIIVIYYFSLAIGKVAMGYINDRFGILAVNNIAGITSIIAFIMFLFSDKSSPVLAIVSVIFLGIGSTHLSVPMPLMAGKLFGQRDFAAINGIALAISTFAMAVGGPLSNYTFDVTGSYKFSFVYHIFLVIGMLAASYLAIKLRPTADNRTSEINKVESVAQEL